MLESPIFWMNLLLFTCFVFDFLFSLIDINSQSFCLSAVYRLLSAQKVFAIFSLDAEPGVNTHFVCLFVLKDDVVTCRFL